MFILLFHEPSAIPRRSSTAALLHQLRMVLPIPQNPIKGCREDIDPNRSMSAMDEYDTMGRSLRASWEWVTTEMSEALPRTSQGQLHLHHSKEDKLHNHHISGEASIMMQGSVTIYRGAQATNQQRINSEVKLSRESRRHQLKPEQFQDPIQTELITRSLTPTVQNSTHLH